MRTDSDRLLGPTRSKTAIKELEEFLKNNCKQPQLVDHILQTFQYETGHEPRKTLQYMEAIESVGKIRLFKNSGELYVQWGGKQELEEPEKEESLMEYAEKHPKGPKLSEKGKEVFRKAELQEKLRNKLKAGPCKGVECPPEEDCENCSGNPENRSEAVE